MVETYKDLEIQPHQIVGQSKVGGTEKSFELMQYNAGFRLHDLYSGSKWAYSTFDEMIQHLATLLEINVLHSLSATEAIEMQKGKKK